jgi:hypothetical protein
VKARTCALPMRDSATDRRETMLPHHDDSRPILELEASKLLHPRRDRPGDRS